MSSSGRITVITLTRSTEDGKPLDLLTEEMRSKLEEALKGESWSVEKISLLNDPLPVRMSIPNR